MHIAFFTNNYLPNPYGVTVSVETLRKELENMNHKVSVFAPKWEGYEDKLPYVYRFPSIEFAYKIRFPLTIPYSPEIENIFEQEQFDVIHAQHPNLAGFAAKRLANKKNIPLVFTWHTLYDQYVHYAPPFIPKKLAVYWVIKEAVKYANASDVVIVPTESVRKVIHDWGVHNPCVYVIPTGVDEHKFAKPYHKGYLRNKYSLPKKSQILFTASRLTEEKNVVFLVHSVVSVLKKNANVWFFIGGEGDLTEELRTTVKQAGVEDRVIFLGVIEGESMKHYMASSDVFVYASKSETQGMIIAESMFMGLPVVALRAPGVKDLVQDKQTGLLVDEQESSLQDAVEDILRNTKKREELARHSKKVALQHLTSHVCTQQVEKVYKTAIKTKNPAINEA